MNLISVFCSGADVWYNTIFCQVWNAYLTNDREIDWKYSPYIGNDASISKFCSRAENRDSYSYAHMWATFPHLLLIPLCSLYVLNNLANQIVNRVYIWTMMLSLQNSAPEQTIEINTHMHQCRLVFHSFLSIICSFSIQWAKIMPLVYTVEIITCFYLRYLQVVAN